MGHHHVTDPDVLSPRCGLILILEEHPAEETAAASRAPLVYSAATHYLEVISAAKGASRCRTGRTEEEVAYHDFYTTNASISRRLQGARRRINVPIIAKGIAQKH
jgi:hypothetical protein